MDINVNGVPIDNGLYNVLKEVPVNVVPNDNDGPTPIVCRGIKPPHSWDYPPFLGTPPFKKNDYPPISTTTALTRPTPSTLFHSVLQEAKSG